MIIFRDIDIFVPSEAREKGIDLFSATEEIPETVISDEMDIFATIDEIPISGPDFAQNQKVGRKKKKISGSVLGIYRRRGKKRGRKRRNISSARAYLDVSRRRQRERSKVRSSDTAATCRGHLEPLDILSDLGVDKPQLPDDLVFELLARLPIRKVFQFTCVSKVWCSIIRDNRFAEAYSNRNTLCLVLSFPQSRLWPPRVQPRIFSTSFDVSKSINRFDVSVFDDVVMDSRLGVTQVINGLFCYYARYLLILANVFTHETMALPLPHNLESSASPEYYFGFDRVNGVYKLLSISSRCRLRPVKILTIGRDFSWRGLGHGNAIPDGFERQSTCVNGVLYWLQLLKRPNDCECRVYSFNLSTEKFSSVPFPSGCFFRVSFVQFRGRLALAGIIEPTELRIYTLEDDQKWYLHELPLPEEFWQAHTCIGNMPTGELFLVDGQPSFR